MKHPSILDVGSAALLLLNLREGTHYRATPAELERAGRVIRELGSRCDSQAKAWLRQEFPGKSWEMLTLRTFGGLKGMGFVDARAAEPATAPDWAELGPNLAEALRGALPVVEDALVEAMMAVKLAEGLGGDGAEIRVRDAFKAQASGIRALLAEAGHSLPAA